MDNDYGKKFYRDYDEKSPLENKLNQLSSQNSALTQKDEKSIPKIDSTGDTEKKLAKEQENNGEQKNPGEEDIKEQLKNQNGINVKTALFSKNEVKKELSENTDIHNNQNKQNTLNNNNVINNSEINVKENQINHHEDNKIDDVDKLKEEENNEDNKSDEMIVSDKNSENNKMPISDSEENEDNNSIYNIPINLNLNTENIINNIPFNNFLFLPDKSASIESYKLFLYNSKKALHIKIKSSLDFSKNTSLNKFTSVP